MTMTGECDRILASLLLMIKLGNPRRLRFQNAFIRLDAPEQTLFKMMGARKDKVSRIRGGTHEIFRRILFTTKHMKLLP